jgi:hypothetical protein
LNATILYFQSNQNGVLLNRSVFEEQEDVNGGSVRRNQIFIQLSDVKLALKIRLSNGEEYSYVPKGWLSIPNFFLQNV